MNNYRHSFNQNNVFERDDRFLPRLLRSVVFADTFFLSDKVILYKSIFGIESVLLYVFSNEDKERPNLLWPPFLLKRFCTFLFAKLSFSRYFDSLFCINPNFKDGLSLVRPNTIKELVFYNFLSYYLIHLVAQSTFLDALLRFFERS